MLYSDVIKTREQAFCHLLLYFSLFEDETFNGEETYEVFRILQYYPFTAAVDFPEEVNTFFDYKKEITDVAGYFMFLAELIQTTEPMAMFLHAAQVALSDAVYSFRDEKSLELLKIVLGIDEVNATTILELAAGQRRIKIQGAF